MTKELSLKEKLLLLKQQRESGIQQIPMKTPTPRKKREPKPGIEIGNQNITIKRGSHPEFVQTEPDESEFESLEPEPSAGGYKPNEDTIRSIANQVGIHKDHKTKNDDLITIIQNKLESLKGTMGRHKKGENHAK